MSDFYSRTRAPSSIARPINSRQPTQLTNSLEDEGDNYAEELDMLTPIHNPSRERVYQPNEILSTLSSFSPSTSHCSTPMARSDSRGSTRSSSVSSEFLQLIEVTRELIEYNRAIVESNNQLQETVVELSERVLQLEQDKPTSRGGKARLPPDLSVRFNSVCCQVSVLPQSFHRNMCQKSMTLLKKITSLNRI